MDFQLLKRTIEESAAELGLSEYEIYFTSESGMGTTALGDEISGISSQTSGGLCFRCRVNGKMGYASTELMEPEEMRSLVLRAAENAANTEKEDTVGIFAGSEKYGKPNAPEYKPMSADGMRDMALELQRCAYATSGKVEKGTESAVNSFTIYRRLVNSYGLDLESSGGANYMYTSAVVNDKGEWQNSFAMSECGKKSVKEIAAEAVNSALDKIGAATVPTGKYNIVIDAKQMRSILSAFAGGFSAKAAQMGLSRLAGREGEKIAADIITITDDPMREGVCVQTCFDAEGVAAYRKEVVKNGVLMTLLHNRETAAKAGIETTGNASKSSYSSPVSVSPYAFCIEAGDNSPEKLLELAGDGILVTGVKGLHAGANGVTGDFSIESEGFLIENGKRTTPVKAFTIAGNFYELLMSVSAVGNDLELGISGGTTVFGAPSVLIENMSVAGK